LALPAFFRKTAISPIAPPDPEVRRMRGLTRLMEVARNRHRVGLLLRLADAPDGLTAADIHGEPGAPGRMTSVTRLAVLQNARLVRSRRGERNCCIYSLSPRGERLVAAIRGLMDEF
jgi:hypothetical protein